MVLVVLVILVSVLLEIVLPLVVELRPWETVVLLGLIDCTVMGFVVELVTVCLPLVIIVVTREVVEVVSTVVVTLLVCVVSVGML